MKKLSSLLFATAFLVPLAGAGPAGAQTQPASGMVQMTVHTHSAGTFRGIQDGGRMERGSPA